MGRPKVRTEQTRQDLLSAALDLLQTDGATSLTARRIADGAGTSTNAMYEFFGDKAGVIRALHSESLVLLDERQAAIDSTNDPRADLVELLAATRNFALDHPMLYQLMTGRPFVEFDPSKVDSDVSRRIYRRSVASIASFLEQANSATSARAGAELVVATHGGLIQSELAGILGRSAASRSRKYRLGVQIILNGLISLDEGGES